MLDDFVPIGSGGPRRPLAAQPPADDDFVPITQKRLDAKKEQRSYTLGQASRSAVRNLPRDLFRVYGDTLSALASPIDTTKGLLDLGAGALREATPQRLRSLIDQIDRDPAAAEQASATARAAGGDLARKYGDVESLKRTLAETPAELLADASILFSGGAAAAARAAPGVSRALDVGANLTNPFVPLAVASQTNIPFTNRTPGRVVSDVGGLISEFATGTRGQGVARNIITEALGEQNIPTIAQLTDPQFRNMSAAEAMLAAGVNRPQFQALGRDVSLPDPQNRFFQREQQRPVARQQALEAVTPDLQESVTARSAAADPLFAAARDPNALVDTAPIITNINETIARNPGNTQLRSSLNEVKRGLRQSKTAEQLSSVNDNIRRLMSSRDNQFIQSNLINVREQINNLLPGMAEARQTFAQMSAPVNQAQILGAMRRRLEGPLDQERPGQFMRVLGEGEEALIRTSTGAPRFQQGDLMRILSEEQGQAVTGVADQLQRDRTMDVQARRGAQGLAQILDENAPIGFRLPNVLNRQIMIANRTLNLLEGKISNATRSALEQAMYSGEDLNRFMNSVPLLEQSAIRGALDQVFNINTMRNVGLIDRMTEEEDEVPFTAELRGMMQ